MDVPINYLAVVASAVAAMVLGYIWFGPLFSKIWLREMGWADGSMPKPDGSRMMFQYGLQMLGALVMAFVFSHSLVFAMTYLNSTGVAGGLMGAFWNWFGFIAPVTLGAVLWERKSWGFWAVNAGYYLVVLCVMSVILVLWK